MKRSWLLPFFSPLLLSLPAYGETIPPLEKGMTRQQVIEMWGAPPEREERETSRQEIWRWPGHSVRFRLDKVEEWNIGARSSNDTGAEKGIALPSSGDSSGAEAGAGDILDDILDQGSDQ